ncbi:MAG: hypothetical protein MK111_23885 [Crocosphaera sp.]|uniref:DEAD/DEAH box helicase n=4 Tax=Crocosphaera TaxID=263510 RepID=UPI002583B766|nr:DEAD/DEAH box helicase [Crocosphaera sp.]MCH2247634.1 hypothetical protein [Crocosphaera sp.]
MWIILILLLIAIVFFILNNSRKSSDLNTSRRSEQNSPKQKKSITKKIKKRTDKYPRKTTTTTDSSKHKTSFSKILQPNADGSIPIFPLQNVMPSIFNFGTKKSELRIQQHQFIYTGYEGVVSGKNVIIEGPTGLGKTRACLASVVPYLLSNPSTRLLYTSATVTQVCNVAEEISEILSASQKDLSMLNATIHIGAEKIKREYTNCFVQKINLDNRNKNLDEMSLIDKRINCKECKYYRELRNNNYQLSSATCLANRREAPHYKRGGFIKP